MYCHFGPCRMQSGSGQTSWNTADAFWLIFRQALLQSTLPAAISRSLETLFLWPMYCHFELCQMQSGSGKTFWNTADAFWMNFRQALLQNTLPAATSRSLETLFLWPMYCHFGPCRTQSGGGKTSWNTADAFWINFRQALWQNILLAAISRSLDTLFLWPMYCHFGLCRTQSGDGKTFWRTADAFWINLWQALLQNTLPVAISFCGRCIAILGLARRNPEVGKRSGTLPTDFGSISGQHCCKIHFWQQFHDFLTHYFCGRCIAILGCAGRNLGSPNGNPGVGKLSKPLPMHFGWFSGKHICTIHFWQQFHCLFGCYVCCLCVAILGSAKGNPGVGKHLEPLPTHFG